MDHQLDAAQYIDQPNFYPNVTDMSLNYSFHTSPPIQLYPKEQYKLNVIYTPTQINVEVSVVGNDYVIHNTSMLITKENNYFAVLKEGNRQLEQYVSVQHLRTNYNSIEHFINSNINKIAYEAYELMLREIDDVEEYHRLSQIDQLSKRVKVNLGGHYGYH